MSYSNFSIEFTIINDVNPLDAVVRAMNVLRRGKVTIRHITVDMSDSAIRVSVKASGEEDEVRWICNKLDKLYDIVNVKYMPEEVQPNKVVIRNG